MARQMKDSGVEWIDEIPEEWEVARLKQVFNFGKGLPITKEDLVDKGIPVISYGQIHAKSNTGVTVQQELIRYVPDVFRETNFDSFVSKNDFILADTSEDLLGCGNCVFVDREMELFAGYHTIILRSTTTQDNKYIAYLFLTDAWRSQIRSKVSGVKLFSISRKILSEATVLVPPKDVQRRIAAFLDRRCAGIDAVIERTRATIEEYKKLKQAVITEAVTKGVRGERKMKDSGIEWIGEIPEGWDIVKLKYFLSDDKVNLRVGPFGSALAGSDFVEEGKWVYNQRVVLDDNFISNDTFVSASKYAELVGFEVIPDDVLITTRGSIGKVAIVPQDAPRGILHPCIIKFRVNQDMIPHSILKHVFNDTDFVLRQIKEMSNSTTIDVLYSYSLRNVLLPLIPMCEQPEIAAYLDEKCAALDTLIAKNTALLTELETYKKSLIYEYVTGKKEVQ